MTELATPNLRLPLPDPDGNLETDVLRIWQAFQFLDSKIAALDILLSSDDLNLDTVRELVAAIKANRADLDAVLADKASSAALVAETAARQLADSNEAQARADAIAAEAQARAAALTVKLDKSGGEMAGPIAFHSEQTFPASKVTGLPGYASALKYQ